MNLFRSSEKAAAVANSPTDEFPDTSDASAANTKQYADGKIIDSGNDESEHDDVYEETVHRSLDSEHYVHDLHEGDHIVRWILLGYCYPVQVHGIVLSVGPDLITIVDCGLTALKKDMAGSFDKNAKTSSSWMKSRRRMNVLTLVDEKQIKKWKKVHYGEECELKMQSAAKYDQFDSMSAAEDLQYEIESTALTEANDDNNADEECVQSSSTQSPQKTSSLWPFCSSKSTGSNLLEQTEHDLSQETASITSHQSRDKKTSSEKPANTFRLPKSDPAALVLARLRFLLEHAEEDCNETTHESLLPPHHIFYANSECIAVWIKTGHWSTLQAAVFLHSSTIGNVKQTATLAMYLSAQTVTIPAAGIWGFFGGTTTISLFSAQPWIVPALVGGGMVYAGLPTMVLWRAKSRWLATEQRLNIAFWENVDSSLIVTLIQTWSGLDG